MAVFVAFRRKLIMPPKKFPRNAPCPCGSGKKYRDCCYDKGFEYLVDNEELPEEDGNEWF